MKNRIYIISLIAALTLLSTASALAQSPPKIGYVDLQRALNDSNAGRRAREEFKVKVDKIQRTLDKQKKSIESLKEQLEKKAMLMKEKERLSLEDDYRKKLRDFERAYKDSQGDLQQQDHVLTGSILQDLQEVILDYGKEQNYTLILETTNSSILYGADQIDLTDEIVKEFNAR